MPRKNVSAPPPSKAGRPRGFSEADAIEAAMRVFWQKGYEGASLSDLTEAMGINRSSMYAVFGDKEALFIRALAHYDEGPLAHVPRALKQPTAKAFVTELLQSAALFLSDPSHPPCCLSLQGLATADDCEPVRTAMNTWRKAGEQTIKARLQRARTEGDLPKTVNPGEIASYLCTFWGGLAVQAATGTSRTGLLRNVDLFLKSLPF